jgi:plastocyanin
VKRSLPFAVLTAAALALPSSAAADVAIQAIDGVAPDGSDNRWSPNAVTVKAGEQVTWSFTGTGAYHNVQSEGSNWSLTSPVAVAQPPVSHTFSAPGRYEFYCFLHGIPMRGTVTVTDESGMAPPAAPPPLSEQPFPNDTAPLTSFEHTDQVAPTLTRVSVSRVSRGARVRFRLSEAGRATLALKRAGKTIKTHTIDARKGANTVTVRGLRSGRYRVEVRARDLSGNTAKPTRARLTVR